MIHLNIAQEETTQAVAQSLATTLLQPTKLPFIITFEGDLGAGKTTFCKHFIQSMGHQGNVKSPTYALVESYILRSQTIHHFDLYRLCDPEELHYLGFEDYLTDQSICLIEWPKKAHGELPTPDIHCVFSFDQQASRQLALHPKSLLGEQILGQSFQS